VFDAQSISHNDILRPPPSKTPLTCGQSFHGQASGGAFSPEFMDRFDSATPGVTIVERRELGLIVQRLRGGGEISRFAAATVGRLRAVRVRTSHNGWRGYDLNFIRAAGGWRLSEFSEWSE
jgi:hypothetical protein